MIALEALSARGALAGASLSLAFGAGVHALVGATLDGGPAVLAVLAGALEPQAGSARVLGGRPVDGAVRPQVARIPMVAPLPDGLRVDETLALAASVREEPARPAVERLRALGLARLEKRAVLSLTAEEARSVALCEALTSTRVAVLLVEEPLVRVEPSAVAALPGLLRARAAAGACVVLATASVRDAAALADDHVILRRGRLVGTGPALEPLAAYGAGGVRMHVLAGDPSALAAALAADAAVLAVARVDGGALVVRGRDLTALAEAVARAVDASGVQLHEMRVESPSLEVAQSAAAGLGQGAFEAARAHAFAAYGPRPWGGDP